MTVTPEHVEAVCAELHRDSWPPASAGSWFQEAQRARVRRVLEADAMVRWEAGAVHRDKMRRFYGDAFTAGDAPILQGSI